MTDLRRGMLRPLALRIIELVQYVEKKRFTRNS